MFTYVETIACSYREVWKECFLWEMQMKNANAEEGE
jgi:hypothetical protein